MFLIFFVSYKPKNYRRPHYYYWMSQQHNPHSGRYGEEYIDKDVYATEEMSNLTLFLTQLQENS